MAMQIAICDDEEEIRDLLKRKITDLYPGAGLHVYGSGDELLKAGKHVDLLLLDIQMPGLNGMDTAVEFRKKNPQAVLIFVTALEGYVFQAFDVGAFHYLVKPFDGEKLKEVLRRAAEQCQQMKRMQAGQEEQYFVIKTGGAHRKIFLKDIVYAEIFNRKIMIHSLEDEIEYYGRISDLERQLGEDFFRPHRAYLIHFKYVVRYNASVVELEKGCVLMAKKRYSEFVKKYMQYIQRKGSWI